MTNEKFTEIISARIDRIKELLISKGKEYAIADDRLHNFNFGAKMSGKTPAEVLEGFLLKHYISYQDILHRVKTGSDIDQRKFDEVIGDILVYFLLQECVIIDSGLVK